MSIHFYVYVRFLATTSNKAARSEVSVQALRGMFEASAGGFAGAPISKAVVLLVSSATLLPRPLPPVIQGLADFLAFPAPVSQLLFSASLLYVFRINERLLGSEKFGVFAGLSVALPYAAVGLANAVSGLAVPWPVAPFAYFGANLVSYALDIPPTSHFSVFGVNMTDKVFVYAAASQVLLTSYRQWLLPAVLGAAFGLAHRYKLLGLARLRVPKFVSRLLLGTLGRLLGGVPERRMSSPPSPSRQPRGSPAAAPAVTASPEALEQLLTMGFDEDSARVALVQSRNNVQQALSLLL